MPDAGALPSAPDEVLSREPGGPLHLLRAGNQFVLDGCFESALPLAEKIARHPYFGFVEVRVPGASPFLMFSNNDDIVAQTFLYGEKPGFEATSLRIWAILARNASGIFDVGAFSGVYALAARAANPHATIYAFEPTRNAYCRLLNNIWVNRFDDAIAPLNFALGAAVERARIRHAFGVYCLASGDSILEDAIRDAWYTEEIDVLPADALEIVRRGNPRRFVAPRATDRLDLAKIDVEGYEVPVLRGMERLLAEYLPPLLIECLDLQAVREVRTVLGAAYQDYFVDEVETALHRSESRFMSRLSRNVLFYPAEVGDVAGSLRQAGVPVLEGS